MEKLYRPKNKKTKQNQQKKKRYWSHFLRICLILKLNGHPENKKKKKKKNKKQKTKNKKTKTLLESFFENMPYT